jgi:hypothetical protein
MKGAVNQGITVKQDQKRLFHSLIIADRGGKKLALGIVIFINLTPCVPLSTLGEGE